MSKKEKGPLLESGLLQAMQAIDGQIAREMQRSPGEVERGGTLKWEPFNKRVEGVSSFLMNALGDREIELDSLLVLSQALVKSLYLVVEDLQREGLGKVRASYCLSAAEGIEKDARRTVEVLRDRRELT
jgi:hypothetical protein